MEIKYNGPSELSEHTAAIVSTYVSSNAVAATDLPSINASDHDALGRMSKVEAEPTPAEKLVPAVPVKTSVTDKFIICLEDGKKFKSLRRHLMSHFGMTPDQVELTPYLSDGGSKLLGKEVCHGVQLRPWTEATVCSAARGPSQVATFPEGEGRRPGVDRASQATARGMKIAPPAPAPGRQIARQVAEGIWIGDRNDHSIRAFLRHRKQNGDLPCARLF